MSTISFKQRVATILASLVLVQVLAGGVAPAAKAAAEPKLVIHNFMFSKITVKPSSKILVQNADSADHTIKIAGTKTDLLVHAKSFLIVTAPARPGTYKLSCDFHPTMHGVLKVAR